MRIFVSEFITSGALSGESLPPSLLREGEAMCSAVIADLTALPDICVVTTRDLRLPHPADARDPKLIYESVKSAEDEKTAFDRMVMASDATLVIAPETNSELEHRVQRVIDRGKQVLNCQPEAIRLCADKLKLAEHFAAHKIPTIRTLLADLGSEPWGLAARGKRGQTLSGHTISELNRQLPKGSDPFCHGLPVEGGCVLKPRDGAGSWLTFGIPFRDGKAWQSAVSDIARHGMSDRMILQPWIAGRALSVGCLCHSSGQIEILPIACQRIKGDRFEYRGGEIPAEISLTSKQQIEDLVTRACQSIAGLYRYIGIDLLLSEDESANALIVEINPRLTTSYVGYRRACHSNLASRIMESGDWSSRLTWKSEKVVFQADGSHS